MDPRLEAQGHRITGPICVGFDVAPNRRSSVAVAGLCDDGLVQVEVIEHGLTLAELVDRIERLTVDRDPWMVAVDAFGVAGNVAAQLEHRAVFGCIG